MNGLPGYLVAPDAFGEPCVWREDGDTPRLALAGYLIRRNHPELWATLVRAVTGYDFLCEISEESEREPQTWGDVQERWREQGEITPTLRPYRRPR